MTRDEAIEAMVGGMYPAHGNPQPWQLRQATAALDALAAALKTADMCMLPDGTFATRQALYGLAKFAPFPEAMRQRGTGKIGDPLIFDNADGSQTSVEFGDKIVSPALTKALKGIDEAAPVTPEQAAAIRAKLEHDEREMTARKIAAASAPPEPHKLVKLTPEKIEAIRGDLLKMIKNAKITIEPKYPETAGYLTPCKRCRCVGCICR